MYTRLHTYIFIHTYIHILKESQEHPARRWSLITRKQGRVELYHVDSLV